VENGFTIEVLLDALAERVAGKVRDELADKNVGGL
jgi:hypothetical protein